MTTQPNKGITFAAPAAAQNRRRPCALSMSQLTWSPSFGPAAAPIPRRRAGHRERMRPQGYVSWKCRKMLRGAGPETGPHSAISPSRGPIHPETRDASLRSSGAALELIRDRGAMR